MKAEEVSEEEETDSGINRDSEKEKTGWAGGSEEGRQEEQRPLQGLRAVKLGTGRWKRGHSKVSQGVTGLKRQKQPRLSS